MQNIFSIHSTESKEKEQRQVRRPTLTFTLLNNSWGRTDLHSRKYVGWVKDGKPEPKLLRIEDKGGRRGILVASSWQYLLADMRTHALLMLLLQAFGLATT